MFNTKIGISCIVWHTLTLVNFLSVHVTHAVEGILSAFLTQSFKGYFKCVRDVFAHKPVSGCDFRTSPLFGDPHD